MKKLITLILSVVMATSLVACSSENTNSPDNSNLTSAQWAALSNYMFAVNVQDFDGDNFEPGTYTFSQICASHYDYSKETPIVWDIYASSEYKPKISQLTDDEFLGSVGGITAEEITVELSPNTYVYVIYNEVVGEPRGILNIEKQ